MGGFGECTLVPGFGTVARVFLYPFLAFGTVIPFFVPSFRFWGSKEHQPTRPFWKPPFCEPPKSRQTIFTGKSTLWTNAGQD